MLLSEIKDPELQVLGFMVLYSNLESKSADSERIKDKISYITTENSIEGIEELLILIFSTDDSNETVDAMAEKIYEHALEHPCESGPWIHPSYHGIDILPLNVRKKYLKGILDAELNMDPHDPYDIQDMLYCHGGLEFIAASLDESIIRELFLYQMKKEIENLPDHMRYWRARTMRTLFESMKENTAADDLAKVTKAAMTIENKLWYLLANIPLIGLVSETQKEKIIEKSAELLDLLIASDESEDNRLLGCQIFIPAICHLGDSQLYKKWRSLIEHAVRGERNSLLRFLKTSYPIVYKLGGIETIENMFHSAKRALTWWP